jgi:hypothetical protein
VGAGALTAGRVIPAIGASGLVVSNITIQA